MRKRAGRSGSNSRHIALLLATTALVGIGAPSLGWADGGSGGDARYTSGGTGGAGYTGASGTDGQGGYANGGGGGGAAGGGPGGAGGSYFTGVTGCCAGGVNPGDPGMNGSDEPASTTYNGGGGGGGAGGSNGQSAPSLSLGVGGTLSGGNGGNGGDGGNGQPFAISGGGGGGGGGGYGAVVTGAGGSNSNAGSISGATGGNGGGAYPGVYVEGGRGSGGDGGDGVVFSGSSPTTTFDNAATGMISGGAGGNGGATGGGGGGGGHGGVGVSAPYGLIITNEGTIVGGNGGTGGGGPNPGPAGAGVAGASLTITNTGTITGGLSGDGTTQADAISFTGGTSSLTLGNTIETGTLNGNISVSGALSIDPGTAAGTNVTLSNTIYDGPNGAGSLTKTGAGSLTLDATNTYSGGTTIEAGTLVASHTNGTSYDSLGGGTVSLNGGTLAFTQSNQTFANAISVMTAGGTISDAGGTYLTNSISGSGPLTFSSSAFGGISLNADNSNFSGTTIVAAGYVIGHDANSLSPNSAFEVAGGTYLFLGTSQTVGSLADYGGAGGLIEDSNGGGNFTLTTGGNNQSTTFSGTIADDNVGTIALVKQGTGTFTLAGANTYSGGTTFSGGTIAVANDGNLGAASGGLIFAGGTLETTADGFASARAVTLNTAGTVQVDTGTATLSGTIADGTGGAGSLTKTGTGTLTLSGANTYTGATNVNGGALSLTGSLAATAMTVASGATFAGSGTSGGSVTIQSGGILAPGLPGAGNVGTLTVTGLTFSSGANFNVDLGQAGTVGGANNDLVIDHGQLTLGGVINVNQLTGFGAGTYRLIDYTGALTNNGVTVTGAPAGSQVQASNGQVNLFVAGMNGVLQFWNGSTTVPNGAVNGGTGSWTNDTANTNWTDASGTLSESWASGTGIFTGAAGTVTVNDAIAFNALEFQTSGYTVAPGVGSLTATGAATITTDSGVTTTIAAPIAGTNGLVKQGSGTLILSGTNTYTGDTTIAAGSLQIGNGGTSGSIVGNVADNGILAFDRSDTTTFGGMISGTGALNQMGSGTLTLTGANTYSGGTTINTGALQLGSGGTTGSITGNVTDNGSLAFDRSDTAAFGGTISGTGAVSQIGTGTLTLSNGANTYSGGTTLTAGVLQVAASSTGPAGAVTSGPLGTGTLTFNGGTLQAGGALLTINNNAVINPTGGTIDAASQPFFVYGGNITDGSGAPSAPLIFTSSGGLGSITLNGANSYAAPTLIDNTGLVIAGSNQALSPNSDFTVNGSLGLNGYDSTIHSLSGAGTVANGSGTAATLTVTPTTTTTFSGVLQDGADGALGFAMAGPGTQILSGANTYTGATTINAGTLQVNGSIATSSQTTVNNTGTLSGTGTVGATEVNAGGTFAPGSGAPGTSMTVAGNLAFASGAIYMVQLNPTTSSLANVAGTALLAGATVDAAYANGSYVAKRYTILTATGGVSGTFGSLVNTNLPAGFKTTLSYDATDAYLNLALSFVPPPGSGLSTNQQNVANAVVGFFNSNGSIPLVFGGLTPAGLTQASGETATGSQQTTFDAMNLFMGLLTDPFIDGRGDGTAYGGTGPNGYASTQPPGAVSDAFAMFSKAPAVSFEQRWSVWGAGFGGAQTTDGNTALGSNTATSSIAGTAVGADYRFSPDTLAGFAIAGGGTSFSVANGGSGRSDLFQAGAFIRHSSGPAYVSAALAYGWQDVTTNRTVTIAGTDMLRAEFNANAWSGRLEGGYRFVSPWIGGIGLTPYAAGQFTTFDLPSYAERAIAGAGTFALNYNARDVTDTRSELGLRTDKSWAMQNAILSLRGRLAWAHDFNPDRSIAATFQTLPGASFVVNGAAQAHDSALTTASAEFKWTNGWSAAATFEGEFSDVTSSYAGKGVVRYAW